MKSISLRKFQLIVSKGHSFSRVILCAFLIISVLAFNALAQDPFAVAPQAYKLQFENDWVRVVRVHYAPFEKIPAHDHPKGRTIFIYLNDGGPVRFNHVEGFSGNISATRPATKAGAFRLAGVQAENHEVENLSGIPSDFLQVELKTEPGNPGSFHGRYPPEPGSKQSGRNYSKVEFENEQVRICRLICVAGGKCDAGDLSPNPVLLVALSPLWLRIVAKEDKQQQLTLELGQSKWLEKTGWKEFRNVGKGTAEQLLIEFKS